VGTVQVFTMERMLAIENGTVVRGDIDPSGDLILTRHDGSTYNAGKVYPIAATTDVSGLVELATNVEVTTGTDTVRAVTPSGLAALTATNDRRGLVQLATQAEALAGVNSTKAITAESLALSGGLRKGTISAGWFFGLPTVTLTDGTVINDVHFTNSTADMEFKAGSSVLVGRSGNTWYVIGPDLATRPTFLPQWDIALNPPWATYGSYGANDVFGEYGEQATLFGPGTVLGNGTFQATMSSTGIVSLGGLVGNANAAVPVGSIFGTLPIAMRPEFDQIFAVSAGGGNGTIYVCADDGTVRWGGIVNGSGNTSWVALDDVVFRAAGYGTFVPLTLSSPWTVWQAGPATTSSTISWTFPGCSPTRVSRVGYTLDVDGVTLFEGIISTSSATAANQTIIDMAAGSNTYPNGVLATHQPMWCYNVYAFGRLAAGLNGAGGFGKILNIGVALGAFYRASLSNFKEVPIPGPNTTGWITGLIFFTGWARYDPNGTIWSNPAMLKTPDGIVFLRGLYNAGTIGASMLFIPRKWRSRYRQIHLVASNGANGRADVSVPYDINAVNGKPPNSIYANAGVNQWFSLNGVSYPTARNAMEMGDDSRRP